ncbi:DNMT3A, partial [Symbiodinium microadriaticum]
MAAHEVTIMLPVQKNDSRGMLSSRTLKCACRAAVQALCPFHAMKRHLTRLSNSGREAVSSRAPLFPGEDGHVISKDSFVNLIRSTLQACDVETTKEYEGQVLQRFTGHIVRVSGAQWLHNLGVPLQMLQVLGRWSSLTILRYLQSAPLQVLPEVASAALQEGQHQRPRAAPWLMVSDPASSQETVILEDSDDPNAPGGIAQGRGRKRKARQAASASSGQQPVEEGSVGDLLTFGAPRREAGDSQAVEALTMEVATIKAALEDLQGRDSFIVQGRSRKHHRIGEPEAANMPSTWATVCGWRYGLSKFYRASWVGSSDIRCQRCFPECFDRTEGSDAATDDSGDSCSGFMSGGNGDSMDALASQAGAGSSVRAYLEARGITSVGTLAMVARDEDGYEEAIIRPLMAGFTTPAGRLELSAEEQPIARAVLLYMFNLAREARQAAAIATTPAAASPSSVTASAVSKQASSEKAPRTLPPKVWTEAVNRYNEVTVAGCKREFPIKRLIGAESIMARFHWEHTVSRCYTPLELGELISKRSFTSTNEVNHLATKKRPTKIQFDGESLQTEEEATWEPRSLWAVVDGLDAIRWCHILFQVGEEKQINLFFEEMICRARQRPNKIEVFREYYSAVSWGICMALNTGRTYKEATDEILNDVIMWNEYMAREPKEDKKRKRPDSHETVTTSPWTPKNPFGGKNGKGKGKKGDKGSPSGTSSDAKAEHSKALQNHGDVILLSFFDGIGSASLALQSLGLRVRASLEWEVDEAALAVSTRVCKGLRMKRGDITQDDPAAVSRILQDLLQEQDSTVLVTAAPPCVDYSAANGSAQGREGASGSLFVSFVYFLQAIEKALGRSFPILVENVLLQSGTDCQWFSEQLQAEPIVADGAAFGMISRPRTWWTRVNWAETTKHPYRPEQTLTWDKHQGLRSELSFQYRDKSQGLAMPHYTSYMDEARARHIPVAGHLSTQAGAAVKPASDMWEQWRHSLDMSHPLLVEPRVEPAISKTVRAIIDIGPEVVQRRAHILRAIRAVRDETQEETAEWFRALPPHVARAYQLEDGQVVQIPLLMHLLRGCGYPDCDNLEADLNQGFPLIGPLRQSPGWHIRTDDWYAHPVSEATFSDLNASHIRHRAARPRADPEWQCMLDEVVAERATGRIEGPFQAHDAWGFQAVAEDATTSSVDLQPMDPGPAYAAFAFSVVQEGSDGCTKVRRCEDYRRSHHNSTIHAVDKPPHDSVETYVRVILFWAFLGFLAQVWCQDLMAAYRQYPVLEVAHAYMLLQLPHGISVWRHAVLPFGASASVWHFNRCRDAVVWLARCLLVVVALHYVDDIGGPEPPWSSQSACTSFRELCELLGIRVKPSKEQPPNFLQKVLGVWIAITREGIEIRPDPGRVQRVQSALQACLDRDELTPEEAARLTGKL